MSKLLEFFNDMRDNGYGLAEIAAQLGTSAIAEPVAGFAAMYDPAHGADAIREGMTYQPRSEAAKMYQQGASNVVGQAIKPVMPVIDAWQKGVDIAGKYSPVVGAGLRTVPTAIGIAMGAKPALQAGRQASESLGAMQGRMVANANAPRTLNTGYMGQRGAIGTIDSLNPTGSVFVEYNPNNRANAKLANNIVSYDKTAGGSPEDLITIYRGLPKDKKNINSGDFVTTNKQLAKDYAGDGHVISMTVKKSDLLDDINEPLSEEYIYRKSISNAQRPLTEFEQAHLTAQRNAALPVEKGGLGLAADNTAMDRARAMGFKGEGVHYTPNDFAAFREGKGDYSAVWVTTDPKVNLAAHNIGHNGEMIEGTNGMPLLFNNQKRVTATDKWDNDITSNFPDNVSELDAQKLKALGFTHGAMGTQAAILDPKNIRSRFAAFDPFNRDSANLLAQYGAIAPTTALGAYMYNEKRKKSQGNQ